MVMQLDAEMELDLDGVLQAAHTMLETVSYVHETRGEIPAHMIAGIEALQEDMIRLLALFEDGAHYGKVPERVTFTMRAFEADATEILEFHGRLVS